MHSLESDLTDIYEDQRKKEIERDLFYSCGSKEQELLGLGRN